MCDLTLGMTEYLALQPASPNPFSAGPREYLHPVLNVLSVLRSGHHHFLPLLLTKVHEVLPRLANPMLLNAPENPNACNMDIFDGFGNAGMAQPPMYQTEQYDTKFEVPRIDEHSNDSQSSNGGMPNNDMNSPYVSSPPIMSPGVEMPHGLPTEYNSLPDMVMSPMGGGGTGPMHTSGGRNGQTSHPHLHQQQHPHVQQHQHPQHQQHHSVPGYQSLNPQLNLPVHQPPNLNMASPNLSQGMGYGQGLANTGGGMNSMNNAMHNGMGHQMNTPMNNGMNNGMMNGVNNGMNNGMTSPMAPGMNPNNMMARPVSQRANTFAMQTQQLRTIGDFQALQRGSSDMNPMSPLGVPNMGSNMTPNMGPGMTTEMDFNTLSR